MNFLNSIGIIPTLNFAQTIEAIVFMLLICIIGFFAIYFINKKINKNLISLNDLFDENFTSWEKNFFKRFFVQYPLWGFVQQLAIVIIFYFLRKVLNINIAIIISSFIFAAFHYPNLFLCLATFGIEQVLLYYFTQYNVLYFLGIMHGILGTSLMYFSPRIIFTNFAVWKKYEELYKKK